MAGRSPDGGANFLFGDGSVRFVSENIHSVPGSGGNAGLGVYQALAHISDGLAVDY